MGCRGAEERVGGRVESPIAQVETSDEADDLAPLRAPVGHGAVHDDDFLVVGEYG